MTQFVCNGEQINLIYIITFQNEVPMTKSHVVGNILFYFAKTNYTNKGIYTNAINLEISATETHFR